MSGGSIGSWMTSRNTEKTINWLDGIETKNCVQMLYLASTTLHGENPRWLYTESQTTMFWTDNKSLVFSYRKVALMDGSWNGIIVQFMSIVFEQYSPQDLLILITRFVGLII